MASHRFALLRIAEQFNESPDLMYYPCEGFALCDQKLPFKRDQRARKDGRPVRRMFCSDTYRQRTKREIKDITPWNECWEEHQKTRASVQEDLDRRAAAATSTRLAAHRALPLRARLDTTTIGLREAGADRH